MRWLLVLALVGGCSGSDTAKAVQDAGHGNMDDEPDARSLWPDAGSAADAGRDRCTKTTKAGGYVCSKWVCCLKPAGPLTFESCVLGGPAPGCQACTTPYTEPPCP